MLELNDRSSVHLRRFVFALAFVACGACKSSPDQPPAKTEDPQSKPDAPNCPAPEENACENEETHEQCLARHEECPGEVMVLESCPVQYACPG